MAYHYQSPHVVCPFYRMETKDRIFCEGLTQDWSLTLECGSKQDVKQYKQDYCRCRWTQCPVAQMIWVQYDDLSHIDDMRCIDNLSGLAGITAHDHHLLKQEQQT